MIINTSRASEDTFEREFTAGVAVDHPSWHFAIDAGGRIATYDPAPELCGECGAYWECEHQAQRSEPSELVFVGWRDHVTTNPPLSQWLAESTRKDAADRHIGTSFRLADL